MNNQELRDIPFDNIQIGDSASDSTELTDEAIMLFAKSSGDMNPLHLNDEFAKTTVFRRRIAHGMWTASLISKVIGIKLPGAGTIYLSQSLNFLLPVYINDVIKTTVTVIAVNQESKSIELDCQCKNQDGEVVLCGNAMVMKS